MLSACTIRSDYREDFDHYSPRERFGFLRFIFRIGGHDLFARRIKSWSASAEILVRRPNFVALSPEFAIQRQT